MYTRIILEGADGCGKTTIGKIVSEVMDYNFIEFPNDNTVTGPYIREWLINNWEAFYTSSGEKTESDKSEQELLNAILFQCLHTVNRLECLKEIKSDVPTVFSRCWQSSYVYGSLDGLDPEFILQISEQFMMPSLNILLDVSPDVSMQRVHSRGEKVEVYESRKDFVEKVADTYRELWHSKKNSGGEWIIIDADKSLEHACAQVIYEVYQKICRSK